jgi:hypothetical protein
MRRPSLGLNGSGGGSDFEGSGYQYVVVSVENQLRHLTLRLPETIILGKRLKTSFGNQIVERDPARQCIANLLDESNKPICRLWWKDGEKLSEIVEIRSGESTHLILFVRKEDGSNKYFAYQPTSQSNLAPKISKVPNFNNTMKFSIEIIYSYGNQRVRFPAQVDIGYDGSFSFKTIGGSSSF